MYRKWVYVNGGLTAGVRPALDAYTRARKIILNHGKSGTLVDSE